MERLFIECTIRAVLLVAGTATLLYALQVKDAATKHKIWTGVMLVMLALPAWAAWGPKAALHLLPPLAERAPVAATVPIIHEAAPDVSQFELNLPAAPVKHSSSWNWQALLLGIYLLGAAALLVRLARGIFRARLLVQCASLLDGKLTSASCVVPVATGWFRPKVILPAEWREWPQAKLDAVLIHEGAHARRRDPLIQGLALVNRAVFWFHPAAWWLENRLSALAEEACDDAVLARGHSAGDYSEYLMEMARAVMQSQARVDVAGLAMPGSSLPRRIRRIVAGVRAAPITRGRMALLTATCVISCAAFAGANVVHARLGNPVVSPQQSATAVPQSSASLPALSSISIRINPTGDTAPNSGSAEGTIWRNASLGLLIVSAYQLPESQFLGLPDWGDSERFDVISSDKRKLGGEQNRALTQALLSDRFKLALHHETQQLPHYELVVADAEKLGPKIRVNTETCDLQAAMDTPAFRACGSISLHHTPSMVAYEATGITMQQFLAALAGFGSNEKLDKWGLNRNIGRPVVDRTGLTDKFDLTLEFAPGWPGFDVITGPKAPPSLSKALEEQLGLKLVPRTGPVDVVVIDHVQLPLEDAAPPTSAQNVASAGTQDKTIFILSDLKITGDVHDRNGVRSRVLKAFKDLEYEDSKKLAADVMEWIRADFQDRGYFRVLVQQPQSQSLGIINGKEHVMLLPAVTEGDPFRLGAFTIEGANADGALTISGATLRKQFHLDSGDLFSVTEIRAGIQRLEQMYRAKGYPEIVVAPETKVDDTSRRVNFTLRIIEGSKGHAVARVEGIQFDGNRRIPSEELAKRIFTRPGDPYNEKALQHDLTALKNSHYFEVVRVEAKRSPTRANATIVIFHLTEKPDAKPQSTSASNLRYDAGSIKIVTPDPNGRSNIGWVGPGPFSAKNASLRNLLASSYQLTPAESQIISGGPEWMDTVRFDIEATSSIDPGEQQKRIMEQALLADQFKLVTHWERQVLPVYSLELVEPGEWGPKLAPHSETAQCIVRTPTTKAPQMAAIGEPVPAICGGTINIINKKLAERSGNNVTMAQVAAILSGDVERPVIDATNLGGEFDYELMVDFSARQAFAPFGNAVPSGNHDLAVKDPSLLFEIIRDQLGLKLVPTNGPVDVLVIDHVGTPKEGTF